MRVTGLLSQLIQRTAGPEAWNYVITIFLQLYNYNNPVVASTNILPGVVTLSPFRLDVISVFTYEMISMAFFFLPCWLRQTFQRCNTRHPLGPSPSPRRRNLKQRDSVEWDTWRTSLPVATTNRNTQIHLRGEKVKAGRLTLDCRDLPLRLFLHHLLLEMDLSYLGHFLSLCGTEQGGGFNTCTQGGNRSNCNACHVIANLAGWFTVKTASLTNDGPLSFSLGFLLHHPLSLSCYQQTSLLCLPANTTHTPHFPCCLTWPEWVGDRGGMESLRSQVQIYKLTSVQSSSWSIRGSLAW